MRTLILLIAILTLAACGGSSGGGNPGGGGGNPGGGGNSDGGGGGLPGEGLRITAITVRGQLTTPQAVSVRGVADQDGQPDAQYHVAFTLGGSRTAALPVDDGLAWRAEFPVRPVGTGVQPAVDAVIVSVER